MQNGNRYYIGTDHLGSPRAISDENGNIIKSTTYDSYGNVISDSNPEFSIPFGFAGGLQDSDTRLIRFGFRDYDPALGRWTTRDPIGLNGGLNVYGYVLGNPVMYVDLYGLEVADVTIHPTSEKYIGNDGKERQNYEICIVCRNGDEIHIPDHGGGVYEADALGLNNEIDYDSPSDSLEEFRESWTDDDLNRNYCP
jgi:RHS repeat-associated protein